MSAETGAMPPETVRLVFCGGCNPAYDRLAAAEDLGRWLADNPGYILLPEEPPGAADIVIAICGCACACPDLSAWSGARIVFITSREAVEAVLARQRL